MDLRQRWAKPAWFIITAAALIAIAPLIVHGCSCGHDFDFHLVSWMEAANQLRHGGIHPQWAFSPAANAGEPRFVFYPPLSWYLGSALGLLLTHLPGVSESAAWTATPILFTLVTLVIAGMAMYHLCREFSGTAASTCAAVVYLANPYMMFTAYERTAYAELLAAAWMPLLVWGILRDRITLPRIAIPLALIWLTNAPAALIASYALALLGAVRLIARIMTEPAGAPWRARLRSTLRLALWAAAGTALGLLIAAFYIIPAAYERRFVQIANVVGDEERVQDNFLFAHTTGLDSVAHDQVLHTVSLVAVGLLLAGAALLVVWWVSSRKPPKPPLVVPVLAFTVLLVAVGFSLTPWSARFWAHLPEANYLNYTWRATFIIALATAAALAGTLDGILSARPRFAPFLALLLAVALAWPAYHWFRQRCYPEDKPDTRLAAFNSAEGSEQTDEYIPVTAHKDVQPNNPPYWLAAQPNDPPPGNSNLLPGHAPAHINLHSPRAANLVLNLRAYPAWQILLDGAPDLQRASRDDGLLAFPIPAGSSTIDIQWIRLPDQKIGDLATLLGMGLLLASMLPARWRFRTR